MLTELHEDIVCLASDYYRQAGFVGALKVVQSYKVTLAEAGTTLSTYLFWNEVEKEIFHCARRDGFFNEAEK